MEPVPFLWRRLQAAAQLVALTIPLLLLNLVVLAVTFSPGWSEPGVGLWLMVLLPTGFGWASLAWFVRHPVKPPRVRVLAVLHLLGAFLLAAECSAFLAFVAPLLARETQALLTSAAALLACTGALVLASLPFSAVVWVAGLVPGILLVSGASDNRWGSPWGWMLDLSVAVVLGLLVYTFHRQFLNRLRAESRASFQTQLVNLLLHDFGEGSQDWVWQTDAMGRLVTVSERLARQLSQAPADIEGRSFVSILVEDPTKLTVEDEEDLATLAGNLAAGQSFHDVEVPAQSAGHHRRWKLSARPLKDEYGAMTGWLGVGTDITEVQRIHNLNARLALLDNLTGLANRHRLQTVLHDQMSPRAGGKPLGLILIDLQNFRMVNEGLGHEIGDALLREVALRLRTRVPTSALLARLGGDEFALLAPGAGDEALEGLVSALQSATDEPFVVDGHRLEVTFQMGLAAAPRDAQGSTELLKCAELALHEAKTTRQAAPVAYQTELGQRAHNRIRLHHELKVALLEGQFELHYQPQVKVRDGSLAGSEALVRWRHPGRGLVSPAEFIPALEETGLIVPVGIWILEAACRDALEWPPEEKVAVNVSAVQFASRSFLDSVRGVLSATGLPARRLELEITESVMAQDPKLVIQTLKELRALGITIALDDFGTGYSSLSYLRQLPLDKLKVDQSFVRALEVDPNAALIIQTVLDLSKALGLSSTAEGVETEPQRAQLSMLGVDNIQGYFYSKPVALEALAAFRASR